MPRTKRKERTFSVGEIMDGVAGPAWISIAGDDDANGLCKGDLLLVDRSKRGRKGDLVAVWNRESKAVSVCRYSREEEREVYGIAITIVRKVRRASNSPQRKESDQMLLNNRKLSRLRDKLATLELLPENEAVRFELETGIARLERNAADDEWPDVIGA